MGAMSEMINLGMGRPADDDMNFHDLDGEGFTARASGRCSPRSDLHAQCAGVCGALAEACRGCLYCTDSRDPCILLGLISCCAGAGDSPMLDAMDSQAARKVAALLY